MPYPNLRIYIDPGLLAEVKRQAAAEGKSVGVYVGEVLALAVGTFDASAIANLMVMAPTLLAALDEEEEGGGI
jgi:hypothetical protein